MLIYVAGPITAPTSHEEHQNVLRAMGAANELLRRGHHPFVPHLSWYMDLYYKQPYERWMELDFEFLRRADALFLVASSPGADREVAFARDLGLPVYRSMGEVPSVP